MDISLSGKRLVGNERRYIEEVLDSEFSGSASPGMMQRFETAFAKRFDCDYAISFCNGTATLHAILEAMEIGVGDEVIVPPLTMASTTMAVLQSNATPIFADVNSNTFQIDPESIRTLITPQTKAIITVALFGMSPDMDPIIEIADEYGLRIIEDNAQCFLGSYKGRLVGTLGDCASYSFQNSKHLTSGEGGIVVTDDEGLAQQIRKIQSLGYEAVSAVTGKISKLDIQDPTYTRHVTMGWNYRMSELCCAVALAQTERIDELVQRRIQAAKAFEDATLEFHDWFKPQSLSGEIEHTYWTWATKLGTDKIDWYELRDRFVELGGDGIYAAWKLTYMEPMFRNSELLGRDKFIKTANKQNYRQGSCPNAEALQPRLFQFKTNYWDLDEAQTQASILRETLKYFKKSRDL